MRTYRIDRVDDDDDDFNDDGPPSRRPVVEALLTAACCLAFAVNVDLYRAYKTTPLAVAKGIWRYGPLGLFDDPPIPPLRLTDRANFHMTCGPDCRARSMKGGPL